MNRINYQLLNRLLLRCAETVAEPAMSSTVTNIYNDALKSKAERYRSAFDAIAVTESEHREMKLEASVALKRLDNLYKAARASVLAVAPTRVLPATLSAQATDTDMLYAIKTLVKAIKEYIGQSWADGLLNGELGAASADAISKLSASILANKAFAEAVAARAEAFGPAYAAFMAFKRVVRHALGSTSKQYMRLHVRSTKSASEAEGEEAGASSGREPGDEAVREALVPEEPCAEIDGPARRAHDDLAPCGVDGDGDGRSDLPLGVAEALPPDELSCQAELHHEGVEGPGDGPAAGIKVETELTDQSRPASGSPAIPSRSRLEAPASRFNCPACAAGDTVVRSLCAGICLHGTSLPGRPRGWCRPSSSSGLSPAG